MIVKGVSRLYYWWNISIIKRRGTFTMLFLVAFVGGWLFGVAMGLSTATSIINAIPRPANLPKCHPGGCLIIEEQASPSFETR